MITLSEALRDTYERVWSKQKSAVDKLYMVGWLCRQNIALLNVDNVTYRVLVDFVGTMTVTPATVNRRLATISKALTESMKLGHLTSVPPMPHQTEPKGKVRWITRDEERRLLDATREFLRDFDALAMRCLIVFLVDTGARLGEVTKIVQAKAYLSRELFPLYMGSMMAPTDGFAPLPKGRGSQKVISFIDTKNGRNRTVPLTDRASAALDRLPNWNARKCIRLFSKVRVMAGLPDVTLHTLRHTCASRLVQGGMDLYRVKAWLGHSTIQVTERYAHLAPSDLDQGVDILSPSH